MIADLYTRTVPNVIRHYGCSVEDARRYIELRDEGYSTTQAALMAGLIDPPGDDHIPSGLGAVDRVDSGAGAESDSVHSTTVSGQPSMEGDTKLWLWRNFVDGRPEYWAFDNPFPVNLDNDDPQTLGEPCGYALFKPSRQGRTDVSEEQVLRDIARAAATGGKTA